jgi:DNA polymerase-3 subunit epsilon
LWPKYNASQKRPPVYYSIHKYEDQLGYVRLAVSHGKSADVGAVHFNSYNEGWAFLRKFTRENNLCAKLNGLQKTPGPCYEIENKVCLGACDGKETPDDYNIRAIEAIANIREERSSYMVVGNGRTTEENSVILVEEGKYLGYGYLNEDVQISGPEDIREIINPHNDNPDIQRILHWQLARYPKSKILNF